MSILIYDVVLDDGTKVRIENDKNTVNIIREFKVDITALPKEMSNEILAKLTEANNK